MDLANLVQQFHERLAVILEVASVAGSGQVRFFDPPGLQPATATEPNHEILE